MPVGISLSSLFVPMKEAPWPTKGSPSESKQEISLGPSRHTDPADIPRPSTLLLTVQLLITSHHFLPRSDLNSTVGLSPLSGGGRDCSSEALPRGQGFLSHESGGRGPSGARQNIWTPIRTRLGSGPGWWPCRGVTPREQADEASSQQRTDGWGDSHTLGAVISSGSKVR